MRSRLIAPLLALGLAAFHASARATDKVVTAERQNPSVALPCIRLRQA
jgi:hypothetical protein